MLGSAPFPHRASFMKSLLIPVPPVSEQRRIVAKLEKVLKKVDACQQRLEKIPIILKRLRQSILSAACSGRLTADWRKSNNAKNYNDATSNSKIPEGWKNVKVREVFQSFGGGTPNKGTSAYWGGEIPWLSSGDNKSKRISSASKTITKLGLGNSSSRFCRKGSVIVVVRSGVLKYTFPVAIPDCEAATNPDIKCFDSGNEGLNFG